MRSATTCLGLLLLAGCGARTPDHVPIDPALSTLVPPDTVFLAGVRVDDLRQTAGFDALLAATAPAALWQFVRDTELEPAEDLWEVLFASNGSDGVLMVRGRFSETGLEPRFEREGTRRIPYRGYMMIGDEQAAVLFMNATTALLASTDLLQSVVDGRDSYKGIPEALQERVNAIDPASQIWAVADGQWQPDRPGVGNWSSILRIVSRVNGLTMAATVNGNFSAVVQADCSSEQEAQNLLSSVNALLTLARFSAADNPAAATLLAEVGIQRTANSVELSANASSTQLIEILEEAPVAELP